MPGSRPAGNASRASRSAAASCRSSTTRPRRYFGLRAQADANDQVGHLDGGLARFGRSYIGEPDKIAAELAQDAAVRDADTVLVTVPNQLGVEFNARLLESIVKQIAPALH